MTQIPPKSKEMNKMWGSHTMEYNTVVKMNELMRYEKKE